MPCRVATESRVTNADTRSTVSARKGWIVPRNATDRLLRARDGGATIVTKSDVTGVEQDVEYDYVREYRDKPWKTADGTRYSGTECKAVIR